MDTDKLMQYAEKTEVFLTEDIVKEFGIKEKEKNALNIQMHRMCEKGGLYRYEPGIYGFIRFNAFAKKNMPPSKADVVNKIYLRAGEGYLSGGHYLNMINLSTWCPGKRTVVSNRAKRNIEKYGTIIRKPKTKITLENIEYLQLLDGIEDMFDLPVDNNNPDRVIFELIKKMDICFLLYLAKNYYPKRVIGYIVDVIGREYK